MRVSESRLRRIIRRMLLESPRQYDHINSYEELKDMYGGYQSILSKLKYRIASEMWNETSENQESQREMYEDMCQEAGMLKFADEIISDARNVFNDPFYP